jgi:hypothetical protein
MTTPAYKKRYEEKHRDRRRAKKAADYAENRDVVLAKANARYHAKKEDIRVQKRTYYLKRRAELLAAAKAWNANNTGSKRLNNLAWRKANPENARTHVRNRAARVRAADGFHTSKEIVELFRKQRGLCANSACRASLTEPITLTIFSRCQKADRTGSQTFNYYALPATSGKGLKTQ